MKRINVPPSEHLKRLDSFLTENGYLISMPCGGTGRCGKCKVTVVSGQFLSSENPAETLTPDFSGKIPACRALCPQNGGVIEIEELLGEGLNVTQNQNQTAGFPDGACLVFSLDIGTTTLAMRLTDTKSGKCIAHTSSLNPQQSFGADVVTRIEACREGKTGQMQKIVADEINRMTAKITPSGTDSRTIPLAVAGNTTMLHIFTGVSPAGMAAFPFTPEFLESRSFSGADIGLNVGTVTLLPSCSAFIGADITAGIFFSGMAEDYKNKTAVNSLLIDIGTNGEIVLLTGGRLYAASAAAGPAMEGGNISCGVGGIDGAVNSVRVKDSKLYFTTVGDKAPVGICSSGLVDLISCLLDEEILDESGRLGADVFPLTGYHEKDGKTVFTESSVGINGKDIREFQLAKSAIRAGVETLLHQTGLEEKDISKVYLAGGLGYYLNIDSAIRVGLVPSSFKNVTEVIGNSAIGGADMILKDGGLLTEAEQLTKSVQVIDLNTVVYFSEQFVENMFF